MDSNYVPKNNIAKRGSVNLGIRRQATIYSVSRSIQKASRVKKMEEEQALKKQTTFNRIKTYIAKGSSSKKSAKFIVNGKTFKFEQKSLFLFSEKSKFRRFVVQVVENKWFDRFILLIIFLNSITMVSYDYSDKKNITRNNKICEQLQDAFTYVFAVEALLKIVEQGFWKHKNSYLRDGWNWIDFIVAVLGLVELFLSTLFASLPSLGPVRMLRAFRPLKSINSIPSMRRLILTLLTSLPALANVVLFLLFVFILFGILGVHTFAGVTYFRCRLTPQPVGGKWAMDPAQTSVCSIDGQGQYQCKAGTYCGAPQQFGLDPISTDRVRQDFLIGNGYTSFDNLGSAIFTIFQVITLEGWTTVMYNLQDHTFPWLSFVYFFLLVVFGSFFILNYFLAVFMDSFSRADTMVKVEKQANAESSESEHEADGPAFGTYRSMRKFNSPSKNIEKIVQLTQIASQGQKSSNLLQIVQTPQDRYQTRKGLGVLALANEEIKEESSFASHKFSSDEEESKVKESSNQLSKFSRPSLLPHKIPLQDSSNFSSSIKRMSRRSKRASSLNGSHLNIPIENAGDGQESQIGVVHNVSQMDLLPEALGSPQRTELQKESCRKKVTNFCFQICDSTAFSVLVFSCILANTILLSLDKYPISSKQVIQMEMTNQIFSAIFFLEMIVKLSGMGAKLYFHDKFNQFDCSIVVVSTIDTTLTYSFPNVESGNIGRAITIFRGFRLLRIFKLARSWKSFQVMLVNIRETLKDIANFSILLGIVIFIYTLVGLELFSYTYNENSEREKPRLNFDQFSNSLVSVVIVLVGEDWDKLMIDTMVDQSYPAAAAFYFISLVIIGSMILLNLFLAILLKNFEDKASVTNQVNSENQGLTAYLEKAKKKSVKLISKVLGRTVEQVEPESLPKQKNEQDIVQRSPEILGRSLKAEMRTDTPSKSHRDEELDNLKSYQAKLDQRRVKRFMNRGRYGEGAFGKLMQLMKDLKEQQTQEQQNQDQQNQEEPPSAQNNSFKNSEPQSPQKDLKPTENLLSFPTFLKEKRVSERSQFAESFQQEVPNPPKLSLMNKLQTDTKVSVNEKQSSIINKQLGGKLKQLVQMQTTNNQNQLIGKSFYLFSSENYLRLKISKFVQHRYFDNSILLLIIISSVLLIAENPLNDPKSTQTKVFGYLDIFITFIFTLELLGKALTFGFIFNGKTSYMHSGWNNLDLFTVAISWISIGLSSLDLNAIKVLRVLRVLRPLKMISRNESLKIQIHSLLLSIPGIINVAILSGIFLLLFGIFFTNFFKGTFYHCVLHQRKGNWDFTKDLETKWDCLDRGETWVNQKNNFDSTIDSFATLFIMMTTEGWTQFMFQGADATGIDLQPKQDSQSWTRIFFVLFTLFGFLFLLNLFMEVVVSAFHKEKEKLHRNYRLTESMREWLSIQIMCLSVLPLKQIQTDSKVRKLAVRLTSSERFEQGIIFCILANTFLLCVNWVNIDTDITHVVEVINLIFAIIFTLEAALKIFALRKHYFEEGWNNFDFIIVIGSWIAYFLSDALGIQIGSQTTIVRSFRIGRILRLMRKAKQLKAIFNTLIVTFPSLANVGALLLLFIYIYSVLGMNLFAQVMLQQALNRHANFQTFTFSFMTLIRASTGEAWYEIMNNASSGNSILYQCMANPSFESYKLAGDKAIGCGDTLIAYLYFISFMMVIAFIFLNLFIAVILQGFNETTEQVNMFLSSTEIEQYQQGWMEIEPNGAKLTKLENLPALIKILAKKKSPLIPFPELILTQQEDLEILIESLELPLYLQNSSYNFTDILVSLAQNQYKETYVEKNLPKIQQECMERYEVEVKDYDELIFLMNEISMKENIQLCKRFQVLSLKQIKRSEKEQDNMMGVHIDSKIFMKVVRLQRVIKLWISNRREQENNIVEQQIKEEELYRTNESQSEDVKSNPEERKVQGTVFHSTMINEQTFDHMVQPDRNQEMLESVEASQKELLDNMSEEDRAGIKIEGRPEFDDSKTNPNRRQTHDFTSSLGESSRVHQYRKPSSSDPANVVSYDSDDQDISRQTSNQQQILNLRQKKLETSAIKQNNSIMNNNTPLTQHLFPYQAHQQMRNAKIGKEGVQLLNFIIHEEPADFAQEEVKQMTESQFFNSIVSKDKSRISGAYRSDANTRRYKEEPAEQEDKQGYPLQQSSVMISQFYSRSSLGQGLSPAKYGTQKREEEQESEGIPSRTTSKRGRSLMKKTSDLAEDLSPIQSSQHSKIGPLVQHQTSMKVQNQFQNQHSLYSFERDWNNINSRYGDLSINRHLQKEKLKDPDNFSQAKSSFPGRISFDSRKNYPVKDMKKTQKNEAIMSLQEL